MIEYFGLESEIERRWENTIKMKMGQSSEEMTAAGTIREVEFRQRVALMFSRLIDALREDKKNNKRRVDAVTLFNMAATASRMDMNFVALELSELAVEMDGDGRANASLELTSRLIRQKLSMGLISRATAKEQIAAILAQANGFDLHHVISEAFNIGVKTSDPEGIAGLIIDKVPEALQGISIVKLNAARLFLMGSTKAAWDKGAALFGEGLEALKNEAPSARWYKHSWEEVSKILEENPDLATTYRTELRAAFGDQKRSLEQLVQIFGDNIVLKLRELDLLRDVMQQPGEA